MAQPVQDNMRCTSCGCEDEASYFNANLGYCPSCGEDCAVRVQKQIKFDKLRASIKDITDWKEVIK